MTTGKRVASAFKKHFHLNDIVLVQGKWMRRPLDAPDHEKMKTEATNSNENFHETEINDGFL